MAAVRLLRDLVSIFGSINAHIFWYFGQFRQSCYLPVVKLATIRKWVVVAVALCHNPVVINNA